MSCKAEATHCDRAPDAARVISPSENLHIATPDEEMQLLSDAVRSLPSHAAKDLLSIGVCTRCVLRLFGFNGHVYFCSSLSPSVMRAIFREPTHSDNMMASSLIVDEDSSNHFASKESEVQPELCRVCLGILQFTYLDDKEIIVKRKNGNDLSASIAELVKKEGYQIDSFSLEVSVPPIILENEHVVWFYMKRKYGSEVWFQDTFSKRISTKDALKFALENSIATLLDVKSGPSSFHIRLTYTKTMPSIVGQNSVERSEACKRRKTGLNNGFDTAKDEVNVVSERSFNGLEDHESSECLNFPTDRINEPCHLVVHCYRTPIYFGGRYLKFSRNVSQTRWIIDDERMGEASVEEIIGGNILPICQGDIYKFHAAGREDIDVRMLGSGRPFLVEIQNAHQIPLAALVKETEMKINNLGNKLVGVKNLRMVASHGWNLMHEGEAEKQKQYCALVWISRPLTDDDLQSITSLKDMQILQRTPIRVLHRRSPLEREKIIHWLGSLHLYSTVILAPLFLCSQNNNPTFVNCRMKIERIDGFSQYFLLHLCTQAGTYIKEFVHGDLGRTHPSIGSILGCRAEILQLDVTDVKMNCFLAE